MNVKLSTQWQGSDLVVLQDEREIDRLAGDLIQRVIMVYDGNGGRASDLAFAVVQTAEHDHIFPAESGIAGRVHFERQAFWAAHPCVHWVPLASAGLPRRLLPGVWVLRRHRPGYMRLPRAELAAVIEQWPLEGPQNWDERKWQRIASNRPFAGGSGPGQKP